MKMIQSVLCGGLMLTAVTSAHAAIISYGGYTHDTTTNIVTGNGLEWLQWDRTVGESIDSIQSQLGFLDGGGWRIASNSDMAQLFNAFDFGITFDADENTRQAAFTQYSDDGDQVMNANRSFISMFGDTQEASGGSYCYGAHCYEASDVLFGTDADADGLINRARVHDDYQSAIDGQYVDGQALLLEDVDTTQVTHSWAGVALVRDVSPVPVPAAAWLFGSGLMGLIGVARRKKAA